MLTPDIYVDSLNGNDANPGTYLLPKQTCASVSTVVPGTYDNGIVIGFARGRNWYMDPLYFYFQANGTNRIVCIPYTPPGGSDGDANPRFWADAVLTPPSKTTFGDETPGISFLDCGDFTVVDIEVHNYDYGIFAGSLSGVDLPAFDVARCNIHDIWKDGATFGLTAPATSQTRRFLWNRISKCDNDGLSYQGSFIGAEAGWNHIEYCGNGTGVTPLNDTSGDGITTHAASAGVNFHDNTIVDCRDGMDLINLAAGGPRNYVVRNHIRGCIWSGISIEGGGDLGNWWVTSNVIDITNSDTAVLKKYGGIIIGYTTTPNTDAWDVVVANNTVYSAATTGNVFNYYFMCGTAAQTNIAIFKNNISIRANSNARHFGVNNAAGATLAFLNTKNKPDDDDASAFLFGGVASNFAGWKTATGGDSGMTASDPQLVSTPGTTPFWARPRPGSVVLRAGENLSPDHDFDFQNRQRYPTGAWDIGAFGGMIPDGKTWQGHTLLLARY